MGRMMILLCESLFQNESVNHVLGLSKAAIAKGHDVDIYLMIDGVYGPVTSQSGEAFHMDSVSDSLKELVELGVTISGCRVCIELRGVKEDIIPEGVDIGGIFDLGKMVAKADLLLMQDAVLFCNNGRKDAPEFGDRKVYALKLDIEKRGLSDRMVDGIELVDYDGMVDLLFSEYTVVNL